MGEPQLRANDQNLEIIPTSWVRISSQNDKPVAREGWVGGQQSVRVWVLKLLLLCRGNFQG